MPILVQPLKQQVDTLAKAVAAFTFVGKVS